MARDSKQVFRFLTVAQANGSNQLNVVSYNNSASVNSTGAVIAFTANGVSGSWSQGVSNTINRAGFRTTVGDQTNIVSGETNGILNDPALFGNLNGAERYCHVIVAPFGAHVAGVRFEVLVEGASDSGTGTAGTDWSAISSAIPIPVPTTMTGFTPTIVIASGIGTLASHGFEVGQILIPQAAGTNLALGQPVFVTQILSANTFAVSKTPYSMITDTTVSLSSNVVTRPNTRRALAIPLCANPKPWVRLVVRAIPNSGTTPQAHTGVLVDNAFLTMGRDCAALY